MTEIDRWMRSGAEVTEGLRLLSIHAPNRWLEALVTRAPKRYAHLLKQALLPFATMVPLSQQITRGGRFRDEWPFLADPSCPDEMKILAADMISSWHGYVDGHEDLYRCATPEDCYSAAENVVTNFSQNRKIRSEFEYYKNHGRVLGKHPVFSESRRLAELRRLPVTALVRKQRTLRGNIWRIRDEMAKGDRPDLMESREQRLLRRRKELAEVERMIAEYERTYR